ncbi:RED-like protein N-terminal region-domain-containing protein [Spinellus fusiger]|nr:RED-like protein N-terminal region-domain-containing protein [Spinellus fusiger]
MFCYRLSQDDFRRLMQTPRASSGEAPPPTPTRFKAPFKTPRNVNTDYKATPAKKRMERQPRSNTNINKEEEEDSDGSVEKRPQYRDRAAERRNEHSAADEAEPSHSTEAILRDQLITRTDTMDAKQVYEQSKYLGGDVDHTHLVKGLDYSLLERVRTQLEARKKGTKDRGETADKTSSLTAQKEQDSKGQSKHATEDQDSLSSSEEEEEVEEVKESIEKETHPDGSIVTHSAMARHMVDLLFKPPPSTVNAQFLPGRMAFVFELADAVGHSKDPFAIPTSVMRSKAEGIHRSGTVEGSHDMEAESALVISKVSQVMANLRAGQEYQGPKGPKRREKEKHAHLSEDRLQRAAHNSTFLNNSAMDCDIFEDVGRDYQLDERAVEETSIAKENEKKDYFKGIVSDTPQDMQVEEVKEEVSALLLQATGRRGSLSDLPSGGATEADVGSDVGSGLESDLGLEPGPGPGLGQDQGHGVKRRRDYDVEQVDAYANDIDMYGLATTALPTSFEDRQRTVAYDGTSEEEDQEASSATCLVDQGTHRNKKAQLTRWDFDNEEEWQKYKDCIEIHPKSAFQFGVKLGDGRKRNRERRGMNDKQKLNREYQQVKNLMDKKYGKS